MSNLPRYALWCNSGLTILGVKTAPHKRKALPGFSISVFLEALWTSPSWEKVLFLHIQQSSPTHSPLFLVVYTTIISWAAEKAKTQI